MHLLRMHFIQLWINDMSGPFELRQRKEKTRSVGALSGKEVTTERGVGWENKRQKPSFKWQCVRKLNDPKKGPVTQRGPSHTTHAPDIVLMHFPSTDTAARIWSLLIHHTINCQQAGQNDQRRMWCLTLAGHKLFFHILVSVLLLYIKKKKSTSLLKELQRWREKERSIPGLPPKRPQCPENGQELHPHFPELQGPKHCFPRHTIKELDWKWSNWVSNRCPKGCQHCWRQLKLIYHNTSPPHISMTPWNLAVL